MSDFNTINVMDDRLKVASTLPYEVYSGGQNVTFSQVQATSATPSQFVFNVIVPSQNVLLDRNVRCEATINFSFVQTSAVVTYAPPVVTAAGNYQPIVWGQTLGITAFPLNETCTTMTATINNNSVSIQSREVMPILLKLFSREELNNYQETTPCMPDNYQNFIDARPLSGNVLAGSENMTLNDIQPRGAFQLNYLTTNDPSTVTSTTKWELAKPTAATAQTIYGSITVSEPLFLSPFLFNEFARNQAGIYGINNMNLQMNMGSSEKFLKLASISYGLALGQATTVTNTVFSNIQLSYSDVSLRLCYITPHPSNLLAARNIVPYYTLNRFTYPQGAISAAAVGPAGYGLVTPSTIDVSSNVLNLNQIPDKFLIAVRPTTAFYSKYGNYADFFLPPTKFTCNWNNNSGLLASANQKQLWKMSVGNGLKQSWTEFSGLAMRANGDVDYPGAAVPIHAIKGINTLGGFLVLCPGKDIQIVEEYLAPGSIGSYQFQCTVTVQNFLPIAFAPNEVELVIIPMMSGMMVFESGTSAVYTAVLSKEMVLDAKAKYPRYSSELHRQVGGNFWDDIKSGISEVSSAIAPAIATTTSLLPLLAAGPSGGGASGGRKKMARHQ